MDRCVRRYRLLLPMLAWLCGPAWLWGQSTTVIELAAPEFGQAWLAWGVDGWHKPPEELWPPDTEPYRKLVRTPMVAEGERFRVELSLPEGTTIDYGVLFTRNRNMRVIEPLWCGFPSIKAGDLVDLSPDNRVFDAHAHRPVWRLVMQAGGMVLGMGLAAALLAWLAHRFGRRATAVLLMSLILLGLGIRLKEAVHWNRYMPDSAARLVGDEPSYDSTARELLRGDGYNWAGRTPLYPAFLALVFWCGGGSYVPVTYVQAVIGVAAIPLAFAIGRQLAGSAAGLIAACLTAISPVLIQHSLRLMSEAIYVPFVLLVVLLLMRAFGSTSARRWVLAGVMLGLSNLIRPTLLMLPPVVAVAVLVAFGWRRGLWAGVIFTAAATLTITPWIVRNYVKHGAIFPLQTSNAILWQGSPEYYHLLRREHYTYLEIWTQVLYGPGWEANDPTSIEGDRWWTQRAIRSIRSEPLTYAKYAVEKAVTLWVGDPNADWGDTWVYNYTWLRRSMQSHELALRVMLLRLMPIVTLLSCVVLWRRWRACMPVYAVLGCLTLLHAATHAEIRLSDPFQPLQFALIAAAAVMLAGWTGRPAHRDKGQL
jgi:hypothetical protein